MSNSIVCTQDGTICLTRGQSIGLSFVAEAGLISFTAVVVLLGLIFVSCGSCRDVHNVYCNTMQIGVYRSEELMVQCSIDIFVVAAKSL
jgi:hypothetical protein